MNFGVLFRTRHFACHLLPSQPLNSWRGRPNPHHVLSYHGSCCSSSQMLWFSLRLQRGLCNRRTWRSNSDSRGCCKLQSSFFSKRWKQQTLIRLYSARWNFPESERQFWLAKLWLWRTGCIFVCGRRNSEYVLYSC